MFYKVFGVQLGEKEIQTDLPAEEKQLTESRLVIARAGGGGERCSGSLGLADTHDYI